MEQYTFENHNNQSSALFSTQHQQTPQGQKASRENVITATADSTSHQVSRYIPKPTAFESTSLLKPLKPTLAHSSRQISRSHPYPIATISRVSKSQPTVKSIPSLNVQEECSSHERVMQKHPKFPYVTSQYIPDSSTHPYQPIHTPDEKKHVDHTSYIHQLNTIPDEQIDENQEYPGHFNTIINNLMQSCTYPNSSQQIQIPLTVSQPSKLEQLILSPITPTRSVLLIDEKSEIWLNRYMLTTCHIIIADSFCTACRSEYFRLLNSVNEDVLTPYQRVIERKVDRLTTLCKNSLSVLTMKEAYLLLNASGYFTSISTLRIYQKTHHRAFLPSEKSNVKREKLFKNILCQLSVLYQNYIKKEASSTPTESEQRHYCATIVRCLKTKIERMEMIMEMELASVLKN